MAAPLRVSQALFERAMRRVATGVSVVTTAVGGEWHGLLARDFIVASADPPTLLISVSEASPILPLLIEAGIFCVNILSDADADVASQFEADAPAGNLFRQRNWDRLATGAPALVDCVGSLDCRVVEMFAGRGYTVFAGQVLTVEFWTADRPPLIHHDKTYIRL